MEQNQTLDQINTMSRTNPIYDVFTSASSFIGPLKPTKALNRKGELVDSKNSLSMQKEKGEDTCTTLINRFQIKDPELFKKQYKEAISGSGKEERRILTLHSSSLCPLLHFYNPKGLQIKLEAKRNKDTYMHVVGSTFEYKNKVFNYPSNMDVVLFGYIEGTKERCLLFLESKFSEYFKTDDIYFSSKYEESYNEYFGDLAFLKCLKQDKKLTLKAEDGQLHYYEGIKQMTAHLIGISNLLKGKVYKKQTPNKIPEEYLTDLDTQVYFGEICYEFYSDELDRWEKDYNLLSNVFNNHLDSKPSLNRMPRMVDGMLTYQDLFSNQENREFIKGLEKRTKVFYNLQPEESQDVKKGQ